MSKGKARAPHRLIADDYPALEAALVREVRAARARDSFQPLLILTASRLLALHLRRLLPARGVPHFNLRFWTFEELTRRLSTPVMLREGKAALPPLADELLIGDLAAKLFTEDSYFSEIADRQGFHRAALATIRELREACLSPGALDAALRATSREAVNHDKVECLLHLWSSYESELNKRGWFDRVSLELEAAEAIKSSPWLEQTPVLIVYGFYDFNEAQRRALKAAFERKQTIAFVPYRPTAAFTYVEAVLDWLEANGFERTPVPAEVQPGDERPAPLAHLAARLFCDPGVEAAPGETVHIISAPGEVREVREVLRTALDAAAKEGIALHEIGILLRSPESYGRLLREAFESLGIEPFIHDGLPLVETRAGRSLVLLLDILAEDFSREAVMEFATFARLREDYAARPDRPGEQVRALPLLWDYITAVAGIVGGTGEHDDWDLRLARLLARWKRPGGDEDEGEHVSAEYVRALEGLQGFIRQLRSLLVEVEEAEGWARKTEKLATAFTHLTQPDEESARVCEAVERLSELDQLEGAPTQDQFARSVREVLESKTLRVGRFERNGPTVARIMAARGVPFKLVIVPGLVEKSFPPPIRQDAILLDEERRAINKAATGREDGPLPTKGVRRLEEEKLLFRVAVGAATQKLVLSFPRIETSTDRERLPSSFLLAVAEAFEGQRVDFQRFKEFAGLRQIPLSQLATENPAEAMDQTEFDLSAVLREVKKDPQALHYLAKVSPFFASGLRLESERWGQKVFTEYDGMLTSDAARRVLQQRYTIGGRYVSPTSLETYAACPYRYLLGTILGLEPFAKPERAVTISPLDRGTLLHEILWDFFVTVRKQRGLPVRLQAEDRKLLFRIAAKQFAKFEEMGATGYPLMWEVEKSRILRDMDALFDKELEETEFLPGYFEVRFGTKGSEPAEGEISTEEPVRLSFDNRYILLRGRIDRIELTEDRKCARVTDYKTGKSEGARPNSLEGGRTLQLALYLHAAQQLLSRIHPGIRVESADYYYIARQEEHKRVTYNRDALAANREEMNNILKVIADGIEAGLFFAVPGDHCDRCNFALVCGGWRTRLYERKRDDPRAQPYHEMREGRAAGR